MVMVVGKDGELASDEKRMRRVGQEEKLNGKAAKNKKEDEEKARK